MSAREVESKGLGKFLWCTPWKFGFKLMQMQNTSSILPWWLCKVIHIKTLSLSSEKYSALPSKWKCISITIALFFYCISSFFLFFYCSFHFLSVFIFLTIAVTYICQKKQEQPCVLSSITIHLKWALRAHWQLPTTDCKSKWIHRVLNLAGTRELNKAAW